jgi:hypothetical protein
MKSDACASIANTMNTPEQVLKRRGILAAAGAVVAGIIAKQTPQPVVATNGDMMVLGSVGNAATAETGVLNSGPASPGGPAIHGFRSPGAVALVATTLNAGVVGQTFVTDAPGVMGSSPNGLQAKGVYGISVGGHGVHGESTSGIGVQGNIPSGSAANTVAMQGLNQSTGANGIGVEGVADLASGIGVVGGSVAGVGVKGVSASGSPIIGSVEGSGSATNGNAGVLGKGTSGPGVQGQSTAGHGLIGYTSATDGHAALIGYAQVAGGIGLIGRAPGSAGPWAGVFYGDLAVNGALQVYGAPKNAVIKHPTDGTYRALYCMESPESWFEDVGEGTLSGDRATIMLDPDFAVLVHTDRYYVFLTPYGPLHLHVAERTARGFTVLATPSGVPASGGSKQPEVAGTFAWRVMAKRKDIAGERLAKVTPPPAPKTVTPFVVPETPGTKTPTLTSPAEKP